jgi:phospholipid/cholesterol/gamma-HCH transport system permease protein
LTLDVVQALGRFGRFLIQALTYIVIPPIKVGRIVERIHFIGFRSLTIVDTDRRLHRHGARPADLPRACSASGSEAFVGPAVALSLIRELGPVLCALSSPAAPARPSPPSSASCSISEQIDALTVMALNPMRYLSPRHRGGHHHVPA